MMEYFTTKVICPGVTHIGDRCHVYCTLIEGEKQAILFDTANGFGDLKAQVESMTKLPYQVIVSHGHGDHTGGNYQFDEVLLHPADWEICREWNPVEGRRSSMLRAQENGIGDPKLDAEAFALGGAGNMKPLDIHARYDLGGLHVQVVPMEGHTPGQVGLLIEERRLLLTSDACNPMMWMFLKGSLSLPEWADMLRRVKKLPFDQFLPAHIDRCLPKSRMDVYLETVEKLTLEASVPMKHQPKLPGLPAYVFSLGEITGEEKLEDYDFTAIYYTEPQLKRPSSTTRIAMLPGEHWWGGSANICAKEPFDADSVYEADYRLVAENQTMPLFVSDQGRYIYSEDAFAVTLRDGVFTFEGARMELVKAGACLREAYLAAMGTHFPFENKELPEVFFKTAQYNTWMQYTYDPTQEKVLQYARDIVDNGFEPGVLIIDEGWHGRYGYWKFDTAKFPDAKSMIEKLHAMGFKVMLWVCPYVCPDGLDFVHTTFKEFSPESYDKHFLRHTDGSYAFMHWWNGYSLILDMTNPYDVAFLDEKLQALIRDYGVDGFKLDGGAVDGYSSVYAVSDKPLAKDANTLNLAWNEFGKRYLYHEYKDTWKGGGKAVVQRLRDRSHEWTGGNGIDSIIPSALINGVIGHPYLCPDMIGGGEWTYRDLYKDRFDGALFVRMAQVSALFPMMQFSWAPWDDLDAEKLGYVRSMARLHVSMYPYLKEQLDRARMTGEPILRMLEYNDPHQGYAGILDEYMVGEDILVAPVLEKGAVSRKVIFPKGRWRDESDGTVYEGRTQAVVPAPLEKLPWFRRVEE